MLVYRDKKTAALAPAAAATKEGNDEEGGADGEQKRVSPYQGVLRQERRIAVV